MFCRKCGQNIPDESVFCEFCGAQVGNMAPGAPAPNPGMPPVQPEVPQMRVPTGQYAAPGTNVPTGQNPTPRTNVPSGQNAADAIRNRLNNAPGQNMQQAGPAQRVNPAAGRPVRQAAPTDGAAKKKPKAGLIVGIGAAAVIGVVAVSKLAGGGGGGGGTNGYDPPTTMYELEEPGEYYSDYESHSFTVNASDPGSMAGDFDPDADRVQALIELAQSLRDSGDREAAEAVYAMIPHAALGQSVQEEREKLESEPSAQMWTYYAYDDSKHMYDSIFGGDGQ